MAYTDGRERDVDVLVVPFIGSRKPRLAGWGLLLSPLLRCLTQALFKVAAQLRGDDFCFYLHLEPCCAKTAIYKFYTSERRIYTREGMACIVALSSL